jgi:hypothetical protein
MSRGSSVGVATGSGLDDWGSGSSIPEGAGNFSLLHRVQTGSGAHSASYPTGTKDLPPGAKWPNHEADNSPPSRAEVDIAWRYTPTPIRLYGVMLS